MPIHYLFIPFESQFNGFMTSFLKCFLIPIFASLLLVGCSEGSFSSDDEEDEEEIGYDGEYCADVEYYNPNTGTRNTYSLNVIVSDNELVEIQFPNGGWMDDDHFSPEELDDNGYCSITSDKGYEYTVQITGDPCSYTDDQQVISDYEDEQENFTCPNCGDEKDEYDEYCMSCKNRKQDEEENTCSRCGNIEYGVYGGLCNNCQEEEEAEEGEEY